MKRKFDTIELDVCIGQGTYGTVYKSKNNIYACKSFKSINKRDPSIHYSTLRELSALKRLHNCRSIVKYEFFDPNVNILYMKRYDFSLCNYMSNNHVTPIMIQKIMYQLVYGIYEMEQYRILHRDLKPDNILLTNNNHHSVICDFGLSRFTSSEVADLTNYNNVCTLHYRSPELLLGEQRYNSASEMWSLGVIMLELLTQDNNRINVLFGKDEDDQLIRIFKLLGTPTQETWPGIEKLRNWSKKTFPEWHPVKVSKQFKIQDTVCAQFLNGLLTLNPKKRWTPMEALQHEYFSTIKSLFPDIPTDLKKIVELDIEFHGIDPTYMDRQPNITASTRQELILWQMENVLEYQLHHSTFFLTVYLIDLYLQRCTVALDKLQLVGIAALFIACKINEIIPLEIEECVSLCKNVYSETTIIDMEKQIAVELDFNLYRDTEYTFAECVINGNKNRTQFAETLKHLYRAALVLDMRKYKWSELLTCAKIPLSESCEKVMTEINNWIDLSLNVQ